MYLENPSYWIPTEEEIEASSLAIIAQWTAIELPKGYHQIHTQKDYLNLLLKRVEHLILQHENMEWAVGMIREILPEEIVAPLEGRSEESLQNLLSTPALAAYVLARDLTEENEMLRQSLDFHLEVQYPLEVVKKKELIQQAQRAIEEVQLREWLELVRTSITNQA